MNTTPNLSHAKRTSKSKLPHVKPAAKSTKSLATAMIEQPVIEAPKAAFMTRWAFPIDWQNATEPAKAPKKAR
jgi:hypothetical protein